MILTLYVNQERYQYIATYIKGKGQNPEKRFLIRELSTGKDHIFFTLDENHPMFGTEYNFIDGSCYTPSNVIKFGAPTKIRFKQYNYYLLDNNPSELRTALEIYKQGRKLFWTGKQGVFDRTYRPTFEFDGVKY